MNNHCENHEHCCEQCSESHSHDTPISEEEQAFLKRLEESRYLPVVRFMLYSDKSEHLHAVALEPAYLTEAEDTLSQVKERGVLIKGLEERGLITIDYDEKELEQDYEIYQVSSVYRLFQETVEEAKAHEAFLFNIGEMECGTIRLK